MKRERTRFTGVYQRVSETRRYLGKPDICFDIAFRDNGKLIWEKIGWLSEGYSAKLATDLRSERMRTLRHGEELPKRKNKAPLFTEIAEKYLEWAKENKTRQGIDDKRRYKSYLAPYFESKRFDEISSFDLERLKSELGKKKKFSPASVKHCLILFRQIWNKAVAWGMYHGENPIKGVKMPAVQNQRERFLSYNEANKLLKKLEEISLQLHDMALLSLHTGMRAGEIFKIKGQDIDFENGLIDISNPKNKGSRKAIMTMTVSEMLKKYITENPNELIFKARNGGGKINVISQTFRHAVSDLKLNAGIEDRRQKITFHSLRHTHASWLAIQGTPILTISHLLGHKSMEMTRKYAHLSPDARKQAVLSLESSFNDAIKKTDLVNIEERN